MTIRFITAWNGYTADKIVSGLSAIEEARMISLGFAVADLDGPGNGSLPVTATTGPNGGIEISSGSQTLSKKIVGQVASRCFVPTTGGSVNKQVMSRSRHVAMDDINSLQVVYVNWYLSLGTEVTGGSDAVFTASIEYPVGTITQAKFSGAVSGTCLNGGKLVTDAIAVTIPRGAVFYVRTWQNNPAGILFTNRVGLNNVAGAIPASGEWYDYGATSVDYTAVATNINNKNVGNIFAPAAIIGMTGRPSVLIVGDSRSTPTYTYETVPNGIGGIGEVERSLCKFFGTINLSVPGDSFVLALENYVKRLQLIDYGSHVIISLGINGFTGGRTSAQTLTDLTALVLKFAGKVAYAATVSPKSTTTDAWATTVNQTADATSNANRIAYNNALRKGQTTSGISGFVEIADQVESSRDSGLWKVTGAANGYTYDGLHEVSDGFSLIETSNTFGQIGLS